MFWLEKWILEEFLDMLIGKLNMVILFLLGLNVNFVGVFFFVCFDIWYFFIYLSFWGGG